MDPIQAYHSFANSKRVRHNEMINILTCIELVWIPKWNTLYYREHWVSHRQLLRALKMLRDFPTHRTCSLIKMENYQICQWCQASYLKKFRNKWRQSQSRYMGYSHSQISLKAWILPSPSSQLLWIQVALLSRYLWNQEKQRRFRSNLWRRMHQLTSCNSSFKSKFNKPDIRLRIRARGKEQALLQTKMELFREEHLNPLKKTVYRDRWLLRRCFQITIHHQSLIRSLEMSSNQREGCLLIPKKAF